MVSLNLPVPDDPAGSGTPGPTWATMVNQALLDLNAGKAESADLDAKAPSASPTFTGNPTAPTPAAGDDDTSIATTAFVAAAVAASPGAVLVPFASTPTWRIPYMQGNGTSTPDVNSMVLWPVRIPKDMTLSGLACNCITAESGATARVCVYTDSGGFAPDDLVVATSALSAASTGVLSETFAPVSLPAGFYWAGLLAVGTGAARYEIAGYSNNLNSIGEPWLALDRGTGAAPVGVSNSVDAQAFRQTSITSPPAVFAGVGSVMHNNGGVYYWTAWKLS